MNDGWDYEPQRQQWLGKLDLIARQVEDWTAYQRTAIEQAHRLGCTPKEISDASGVGLRKVQAIVKPLGRSQHAREDATV